MSTADARQTVKAINRRFRRKDNAFTGGQAFGVDYPTFRIMYPHTAEVYREAASAYTGKAGRYMPAVFR